MINLNFSKKFLLSICVLLCIKCSFFCHGFHIRRMQEEEPIPEPDEDIDSIVDTSILGDIQSCLEAKNGSGFYRLLLSTGDEATTNKTEMSADM